MVREVNSEATGKGTHKTDLTTQKKGSNRPKTAHENCLLKNHQN